MAVLVKNVTDHLVTVVESPFGNWFLFDEVRAKGDGYDRITVTLDDENGDFRLIPGKVTHAQVLDAIQQNVCPATTFLPREPDGWDTLGRPVWVLTPALFRAGVVRVWAERGDRPELRHLGQGEWDIDAIGADMAVQYALFGGTIYG
jgi:hypothetical protein